MRRQAAKSTKKVQELGEFHQSSCVNFRLNIFQIITLCLVRHLTARNQIFQRVLLLPILVCFFKDAGIHNSTILRNRCFLFYAIIRRRLCQRAYRLTFMWAWFYVCPSFFPFLIRGMCCWPKNSNWMQLWFLRCFPLRGFLGPLCC